jgi:hypothetical protein
VGHTKGTAGSITRGAKQDRHSKNGHINGGLQIGVYQWGPNMGSYKGVPQGGSQ